MASRASAPAPSRPSRFQSDARCAHPCTSLDGARPCRQHLVSIGCRCQAQSAEWIEDTTLSVRFCTPYGDSGIRVVAAPMPSEFPERANPPQHVVEKSNPVDAKKRIRLPGRSPTIAGELVSRALQPRHDAPARSDDRAGDRATRNRVGATRVPASISVGIQQIVAVEEDRAGGRDVNSRFHSQTRSFSCAQRWQVRCHCSSRAQ